MTEAINKNDSGETGSNDNSSKLTKSTRQKSSTWDVYFPQRHKGTCYEDIRLASFPTIVLFWPMLVALFTAAVLQSSIFKSFGVDSNLVGWSLVVVAFFNFLPLVQDFDFKKFSILVLLIVALILSVWICNLYGLYFFKAIGDFVIGFRPEISADACLVSGTLLLFLISWGLLSPIFSYWKLEQNEFVHYTRPMGKDMSIARIGCTIYKEIPDVIESFLTFGGGSLVIRKDNQILAKIENIPFLRTRMEAIEHMMSETKVVLEK